MSQLKKALYKKITKQKEFSQMSEEERKKTAEFLSRQITTGRQKVKDKAKLYH